MTSTPSTGGTRAYDNRRRSVAAAETRQRILDAAKALAHDSDVADWTRVTIVAVADAAGVSERTVYRHFVNESGLREAVIDEFQSEAGIELDGLELDGVSAVVRQIYAQLSAFQFPPRPELDPVLAAAFERQQSALLSAIGGEDRPAQQAAAVLDLLWSSGVYERLTTVWHLSESEAANAAAWAVDVLTTALANGSRPST